MPEYSTNLNIEKALGTENVNRAYFMRVIDDIDEKVGVPNGLAKLDANGNVLKADGTQAGEVTKTQFDTHTGLAATTLKVGHVQLSDAVTSTDVTKAATSNAVKKAYDRADAAFTSASNGKAAITNAVTGADPRVVVPTDPTFAQLATAVGQIQTGKKWASGKSSVNERTLVVTGLTFKPNHIIVKENVGYSGLRYSAIYSTVMPNYELYGFVNSSGTVGLTSTVINSNGFEIATSGYSTDAHWIAFE